MEVEKVKEILLNESFVYYPVGVVLYNGEGEIIAINRAVSAKFGIEDKSEFMIPHLFQTTFLTDLQKEHLRRGSTINDMAVVTMSIIPYQNREEKILGYTLILADSPKAEIGSRHERQLQEFFNISEKVALAVPDTILLVNRKLCVERVIAVASDSHITPDVINCRVDEFPVYNLTDRQKERIRNTAENCFNSKRTLKLNIDMPITDGTIKYYQVRIVPIENKYILVYTRNITDQVEREIENQHLTDRLSESRHMMELALQNSKVATYCFNYDIYNGCDKVNCKHCFQFHGSANDLLLRNKYVCRTLTSLRHPEDQAEFFTLFEHIRNNRLEEAKANLRLKNDAGEYRNYEVSGKVQECDNQGNPSVIIGLVIDEQERVEQEASLLRAKEEAETAGQLKSTFLANMTHEIRSPLQAIVGFSDLLSTETDEGVREEYMNLIKTNNDLLANLINDVLDISKIEADMITFSYMDIHLADFVREIYATMKLRVTSPNIMLILDPCEEITLHTDKNRLAQVLMNLITNAIKHTEKGSIRFGYEVQAEQVRFYVSDTGKGIPEDRIEQIFSRFVQLKGAKQGIGLGLAICKGLVEKMGGDIKASSVEGEGSVFEFTLPFVRPEA
ncbi:HAMP domain-containing histidine kinase [Parabacteroides sp. OttesenSCG-928-O15]|nr:HAMP domain-containing histidine kinase [Parabacteroides sp. OttesenSCG-928-O15]